MMDEEGGGGLLDIQASNRITNLWRDGREEKQFCVSGIYSTRSMMGKKRKIIKFWVGQAR